MGALTNHWLPCVSHTHYPHVYIAWLIIKALSTLSMLAYCRANRIANSSTNCLANCLANWKPVLSRKSHANQWREIGIKGRRCGRRNHQFASKSNSSSNFEKLELLDSSRKPTNLKPQKWSQWWVFVSRWNRNSIFEFIFANHQLFNHLSPDCRHCHLRHPRCRRFRAVLEHWLLWITGGCVVGLASSWSVERILGWCVLPIRFIILPEEID